jgi:hypothetical protein
MNPLLQMDQSDSMSGVPVGTASPIVDRGAAPHTQPLGSDSQGYLVCPRALVQYLVKIFLNKSRLADDRRRHEGQGFV